MTLGLYDGTNNFGIYTESNQIDISKLSYGTNVGTTRQVATVSSYINSGITTDPTKSGIIVEPDIEIKLVIKY